MALPREMVKRRFLISGVFASNITVCHRQHVACELQVDWVYFVTYIVISVTDNILDIVDLLLCFCW